MPRGVRLQPGHGLEGFILSARHLCARRQLQGGFLCSPEQQPRAVRDEQQNENNLLRPGEDDFLKNTHEKCYNLRCIALYS